MLTLSVLDQSPVRQGVTPRDALMETIELARHCEALGYRRYWLAEHHATPALAGSAPEIMIARIAAETSHIRVGSGGVMLSHYSSLKVAEQFRMLETLYPGRIDLGIGRAPGSDQLTAAALAHGPGALGIEHFPNQIADLIGYLEHTIPSEHPFSRIQLSPDGETLPEIWILGSSDQSAIFAAYFGRAFSFAHFITDEGGPEIMAAYQSQFRPSARRAAPRASIGVFVSAPTARSAPYLAASRDLSRLRSRQGILSRFRRPKRRSPIPIPTSRSASSNYHRRRQIVGTPETVKPRLEALAASYGVDEIVVLTITHDYEARKALLHAARRSVRAGAAARLRRLRRMVIGLLSVALAVAALCLALRLYMGRAAEDALRPGERVALPDLRDPIPGNAFLACPPGYCAATAAESPVFALPVGRLAKTGPR